MMKSLLSLLFLVVGCATLGAQSYIDALRYSFVSPQGSARFAATGGSLTPMGVDLTTIHTNPAGIGWNRYSMVQVTPGFSFTNTDATLIEGTGNMANADNASAFTLPSAGVLFAGSTRSVNWSTLNFAIGVTRLADYNQTINFTGRSEGSVIDGFVENLNIGEVSDYGSGLALDLGVLLQDDLGFFSDFDRDENLGGQIRRDGIINRSGSMNEFAVGFGGNYREKLMWGLSLGIPFLNYEQVYEYDEVDDQDQITAFESSVYDQKLTASGAGFNIKAGLIYRVTDGLRVSAGLHSPTFWSIDEEYETTFGYNFTEDGQAMGGSLLSPTFNGTFNLQTPWRFNAGAGYLVGNNGFVSLDVDYANYAGNTISFDDFANLDEGANADIDDILTSSIGVRLGGELNVSPLQVRAGVGYRQVPYNEYLNDEDQGILTLSGGLGFSTGKFFVDFAAQYEGYSSFQPVYETLILQGNTITTDRSRISALLTVGLRGFGSGF